MNRYHHQIKECRTALVRASYKKVNVLLIKCGKMRYERKIDSLNN